MAAVAVEEVAACLRRVVVQVVVEQVVLVDPRTFQRE
jgi:hypothetical protein